MHVYCTKCSQPIALTDIIESSNGRLSHLDCKRPQTLTPEERALLFVYCSTHAVAKCIACGLSFRFAELAADVLGGRSNICPRCRHDLTENARAHLFGCERLPEEIRRQAQEVRETAQGLVKHSMALRDTSDVLMREMETALFRAQQSLKAVMARRAAS
jgi:hypothetical protein